MSRLGIYVLCGLLCSCSTLALGAEDSLLVQPEPPVIIPVKSDSSTAATEKTKIPVLSDTVPFKHTEDVKDNTQTAVQENLPPASPDTSSKTTTTTTLAPTTTKEPTTTTKRTTTTEPTTTTTNAPTPKPSPPAPTPKPSPPAPMPQPDQGTWAYTDPQTNVTCIVVQFAAQLNVTYTKMVENKTSLGYYLINVPSNATVMSGTCTSNNNSRQWIVLGWSSSKTAANTMALHFAKNETTKNYMLESVNVTLEAELFPNATSNASIELSHGSEWMTPLATSYRCSVPTRLNMSAEAGSSGQAAVLTLAKLQEEAFRTSQGKGFSAARECGGGDVPDAVPIAVGCALGGLVIVVLVAYLVGRRRSAARGYLSM